MMSLNCSQSAENTETLPFLTVHNSVCYEKKLCDRVKADVLYCIILTKIKTLDLKLCIICEIIQCRSTGKGVKKVSSKPFSDIC